MALTLIQKSSTFKPDMIGDVVEVTTYDPATGEMGTVAGVLRSYVSNAKVTRAFFDGDADDPTLSIRAEDKFNISITHYEFALGVEVEEDGE